MSMWSADYALAFVAQTDNGTESWTYHVVTERGTWQQRTSEISRFVGEGNLHIACLIFSAFFLSYPLFQQFRTGQAPKTLSAPSKWSRTDVAFELSGQFLRCAAVVLSCLSLQNSQAGNLWTESLLLGYILAIGLLRITIIPRASLWRFVLLHHTNALLLASLSLALATDLLPSLILGSTHRTSGLTDAKVAVMVVAVFVTFMTPREWRAPALTFDLLHREPDDGPSPEETCSWFSYYVSYEWMTSRILLGWRGKLSYEGLLPLPWYDEPVIWLNRIVECRKRWGSTLHTMLHVLCWSIVKMIAMAFCVAIVDFVAPLAMFQLLGYLENPEHAVLQPGCWILLLFLGPTARSVAFQQYIFTSTRLIVRTKLSLIQELYRKALRCINYDESVGQQQSSTEEKTLSNTDLNKKATKNGHISNLMSFDTDALWRSRDFVLVSVLVPIETTVAMIFLYQMLDWSCLVGLFVLLSSFPIAQILSTRLRFAQKAVMIATDRRISLISEYLSSIRTIKYFAWEEAMSKKIEQARIGEQRNIWKAKMYELAINVSNDFFPLLTLFVMFLMFTLVNKRDLTAAIAFTALSVTDTLRQQFVYVSNVTRFIAQSTVACQRLDNYFKTATEIARHPVGPPAFHNATFRRTPIAEFRLRDLSVEFVEGRLNIITGPSGCGKSTLLLSLIGETILESGDASCPKDVAYASQSAWLMNATVRDNIVFYQPFEQARYDAVVDACGLRQDFTELDAGDQSSVGDNGAMLSGGQRQRIALARVFYSKSTLLLLDDIFSALDVETAAHVWEKAFHGHLVEGRTVILVTQQSWLSDAAELSITMAHGEIVKVERHSHPRGSTPSTLPLISDSHSTNRNVLEALPPKAKEWSAEALRTESTGLERNERTLFYQYMYLFGGHYCAISLLVLSFLAQLSFFSIILWLSVWVGQYTTKEAINVGFYLAIYAALLLSTTVLQALDNVVWQYGAWRAARDMHKRLVNSILSVSLDWFTMNPPGRIVNRFSKDVNSMDVQCVDLVRQTSSAFIRLVLRIGGVGAIMPIFALPAALVCGVGFMVGEMYTKAQLSAKKMTSATQSPIFSQFADTMSGLSVIRARNMQDVFGDVLARKLRLLARAEETQFNLNRWVSVRADACAAIISAMAGMIALSKAGTVSAGIVGFSLTNAIGLSTTIINLVRSMNDLEIELNSFHRVREYADLPAEESPDFQEADRFADSFDIDTPAIEFRNVTASYSAEGPDILKNISFLIKAGERVAIIGRTGSGKSTLALCLLRFVHVKSGQILIDGIDIANIALPKLRRKVTMIPQEPVLFSGTVRTNLDPTDTVDEQVIQDSLHACSSIAAVSSASSDSPSPSSTPTASSSSSTIVDTSDPSPTRILHTSAARISMTTPIAARGDNLSQGERQILGIARALARQSKILLLDEATASVDYASDAAIQQVLRKELAGKTIVTIAHRLRTIVDYDRVVVLGGGEVLEMGAPKELWKNKGVFWGLCGVSREKDELRSILEDGGSGSE